MLKYQSLLYCNGRQRNNAWLLMQTLKINHPRGKPRGIHKHLYATSERNLWFPSDYLPPMEDPRGKPRGIGGIKSHYNL